MKKTTSPKELFFSRNDPEDPRLGERIRPIDHWTHTPVGSWLLFGYPDDEGIRLNGGRPGAAMAPNAIRQYLFRMTPPMGLKSETAIFDLGNLDPSTGDLSTRHSQSQSLAQEVMSTGRRWLSFGGGHDYGFADAAAFVHACQAQNAGRPLVINFDAHLDVRPFAEQPHSGTPFRRLLQQSRELDFLEIGIQGQCNSTHHLNWCLNQGGHVLSLDEILLSGEPAAQVILKFLTPFCERRRPTFLSVDIDAFAQSHAPGCSQSWPTGLEPNGIWPVFQSLFERMDVWGMGIYEVSPPLDFDGRTSKLAALLAHRALFYGTTHR